MVCEKEDKTMRFQFTKIEMDIRHGLDIQFFFVMQGDVCSNEKRSNENRYNSRSVNGWNANRRKLTNNPSKLFLKHKPGPACPLSTSGPPRSGYDACYRNRRNVVPTLLCRPTPYPPTAHRDCGRTHRTQKSSYFVGSATLVVLSSVRRP